MATVFLIEFTPFFGGLMKRWDFAKMHEIGLALFAPIHKQKHLASPNHDLHFMARELKDWLVLGVNALIEGNYTPRFLKRLYFKDERVDQLHLSDRILQHVLLRQLKPTFPYVMNPNCYHLQGPSGVAVATKHIQQVLKEKKPKYVIRADIKSFYKSISHALLIDDIKKYYDDPKIQVMLENIITNPIETPRGYQNPDYGIALRGPLSQFFSGLYLKPLDDAFTKIDVTYLRYQDDILIFCQSKRQLNRCKQRMMVVLQERQLSLSSKKTHMGSIDKAFHFLGIHYPGTRPQDNIKETKADKGLEIQAEVGHCLASLRGGVDNNATTSSTPEAARMVPHPRTIRKAREQVKQMVIDGISSQRIKSYLHQWCLWWERTSEHWQYQEILGWFLEVCWDATVAAYAALLVHQYPMKSYKSPSLAPAPCQVFEADFEFAA